MIKRGLLLALILLMSFSTGCWNRREPEEYAWLTAIALDRAEGNRVKITVVITPPLSPIPTGAAPPEKLFITSSATGETLFEAARNITTHVPKRVFWGYLRAVIIGEELARSGVEQHMDLLYRDHEIRKNPWVFVIKGSVDPLFEINPQLERYPTKLIEAFVKAEQSTINTSRVVRLKEFQREIADSGIAPVVSVAGVWDSKLNKLLEPGQRPTGESELAVDGSAVFREGKLIDWLSPEESNALLFARGELKKALVIVPHPDNPQNKVGVEIVSSKQRLRAEVINNKVKATVTINVRGNLGDQRFNVPPLRPQNALGEPEFYKKLGENLREELERKITALLKKSQEELQADILGIGDYIQARNPAAWAKVSSNWPEFYKEAEITLEVKTKVTGSGIMRSHYPKPLTED